MSCVPLCGHLPTAHCHCPMCLRLTFPISQGHSKVHWGVAGVSLSGEISSSGCKAKQVLLERQGCWEPRMGLGDLGDPVIPHSMGVQSGEPDLCTILPSPVPRSMLWEKQAGAHSSQELFKQCGPLSESSGGSEAPRASSFSHLPNKASTHFTWFPRTAYSSGVPPFCQRQGQGRPTFCLVFQTLTTPQPSS